MIEPYNYNDEPSGRSETLVNVLDELERTKKQLAIAVEALSWYDGLEDILIGWELGTGQKKGTAKQALKQIRELEK